MALKLLVCLLLVAGATTAVPSATTAVPSATPAVRADTTTSATTASATTASATTASATTASPTTTASATTASATTASATTASPTTTASATTASVTTTANPSATTTTATATTTTTANPSATTTTAPSATTEPPGVCASNGPCGTGSTCQERAEQTYVCLCLAGDYYDDTLRQCILGKVFPGEVTYSTQPYSDSMSNTASADFKDVADDIQTTMKTAFKPEPGYRNTTVTKISKKTTRNAGILATVEVTFDKDSEITAEQVKTTVSDKIGPFEATPLCVNNPCDITATCVEDNGAFACKCKPSYFLTDYSNRVCVACPNNQKRDENICKPCAFGYSGLNCGDNWQQILVIVGSLLGGILLLTIIVSTVMALKTKKKLKKGKATDYAKPNSNPAPVKTPHVSNGSALPRPIPVQPGPAGGRPGFGGNVMPRIPRATANEGWDRSNLEMVPSNSRQNLIPAGRNSRRFDEHDDPNPYSRPMKPQNNPYAMGRPQVNPYASSQGHSNPYYRNDEGKRF